MTTELTLDEKLQGRAIRRELGVEAGLKSLMWRRQLTTLPPLTDSDKIEWQLDIAQLRAHDKSLPKRTPIYVEASDGTLIEFDA